MEIVTDVDFLHQPSVVTRPHQVRNLEVMLEAISLCKELDGAAIAAPQIGLHQRWFVTLQKEPEFIFNPEIIESTEEDYVHAEGCLSLPNAEYVVRRALKLRVKYQELDGRFRIKTLTGLEAIIFQHELDHLNGILISDKGEKL